MIDLSKINSHAGDKKISFEEMISQLAFLEKISNSNEYIRTGAGADGGAECYWILENGDEVCWQAKFFSDKLESSEWGQIKTSIVSLISKHPKVIKYIICTPLNRPDSRKLKANGTPEQTAMEIWNENVRHWTTLSAEQGLDISFEYWGETEILYRLNINDVRYEGIKSYFYGTHALNMEKLTSIMNKNRIVLGERYSEDDNVELDISKIFYSVSNEKSWKETLQLELSPENIISFSSIEQDVFGSLQSVNNTIDTFKNQLGLFVGKTTLENLNQLRVGANELQNKINSFVIHSKIMDAIDDLQVKVERIRKKEKRKEEYEETKTELEVFKRIEKKAQDNYGKANNILEFLISDEFRAFMSRIVIIDGEAGIGKSHLLCDSAINLLNNNVPVLFLLGQHYNGGSPISFIEENLGLGKQGYQGALSSLNSMAESYQTRFVIIIDAINEGAYRDDWKNHISQFVTEIQRYENLALIISCRSTYKNFIIPKEIIDNCPSQAKL